MGCRERASAKDLIWPLALQLERGLLEGTEVIGAIYGLSKAFDTLPLGSDGILWKLAAKMKFPAAIAAVMKDMYTNLERRFKFNGFLGKRISPDGLRGAL